MAERIIKKYIPAGAPAYMSQFTMIMLILVCMCMILSILSKKQESGFQGGEGMGKESHANALGIVIGSGVFRFGSTGRARTFADNPGDLETQAFQNPHVDLLKGEGGSGNTDLKAKDLENAKFIFASLSAPFPPKSAAMTAEIDSALLGLGTGMSMFDFTLTVKTYCAEYPDEERNRRLAFARGMRIIKELRKRFNVPLDKMSCVVFSDRSLIMKDAPQAQQAKPGHEPLQETAFVMKVK